MVEKVTIENKKRAHKNQILNQEATLNNNNDGEEFE